MKLIELPIEQIVHGDRHRTALGDLEALAANIEQVGLLQPIGVTSDFRLVYGYRRLCAYQDFLKRETIPALVIDIDSILAGEYSENEMRKAFTVSERARIGAAIEKELGNRRGVNLPNHPQHSVSANAETGNTVDLAAKRAGFDSAETFVRAKAATARGAPELVAAMDAGEISPAAAADISRLPRKEQRRIVEMPKKDRNAMLRQIRATKANEEANAQRAHDLMLYRGLAEAVAVIANHAPSSIETWEGLSRVSAFKFNEHLDRAIACLVRLQKEHPNVARQPKLVGTKR